MKVVFELNNERSGANIWAERLCPQLNKSNIPCAIRYHHFFNQLSPVKFNDFYHNPDGTIQHANIWNGFAFKTKNPLVVTEHTAIHDPSVIHYKTIAQKVYHGLIKRYESRSLTVADRVTCVSHYTKKNLEETFGYYDAIVIPNGVDNEIFRPLSKEGCKEPALRKTVLLFVGNLTRMKGADLLPEIMKNLGDQYILYVTSGFKHNTGVSRKNILNIGTLDQDSLVKAYNSCDIFLSPSRLEGFGLSIAEAMACGKPVVATDCSAIPELLIDGKGGFLSKIDNVNDFADKISQLANDNDARIKMGQFNRKRVLENFTLERMTEDYIRLYHSLD
jgi:glycosyltransferase involved in cell wall biosynthesis